MREHIFHITVCVVAETRDDAYQRTALHMNEWAREHAEPADCPNGTLVYWATDTRENGQQAIENH